ncbi:MAG: hypothetical protein KBH73_09380 [Syntrophobacterales bacterium]|nr:hypothetical protein [Syntrophobacterales bacterium]
MGRKVRRQEKKNGEKHPGRLMLKVEKPIEKEGGTVLETLSGAKRRERLRFLQAFNFDRRIFRAEFVPLLVP